MVGSELIGQNFARPEYFQSPAVIGGKLAMTRVPAAALTWGPPAPS